MTVITPPYSPPKPLQDKSTLMAFIVCLIGFGGFITWAAFAPLAEGVMAGGVIVVEDNRKVVQHLEGGIIKNLLVREGDIVSEGDILVELEPVAALAQRDQSAQELAAQYATIARATAVLNLAETPDFSTLHPLPLYREKKTEIIQQQQALFEQQRDNFIAENEVLQARITSQRARERDRNVQIAALDRALEASQEEMSMRLTMLADKHETIYTIQNLERNLANLEAERASLVADRNQAKASANEIAQQIKQAKTGLAETLSTEMAEARRRALTAQEQLTAAEDVLARTTILAPREGKVLNMVFSTVGGVIRAGEPIMEIVPRESMVIAELRVRPSDRDAVAEGQKVKAQLSAYKRWRAKQVDGIVISISADLKTIPETGEAFYSTRVKLDGDEIAAMDRIEVIPGMPVEAFISSGSRRTFLDYLLEPLEKTIQRGTQGT